MLLLICFLIPITIDPFLVTYSCIASLPHWSHTTFLTLIISLLTIWYFVFIITSPEMLYLHFVAWLIWLLITFQLLFVEVIYSYFQALLFHFVSTVSNYSVSSAIHSQFLTSISQLKMFADFGTLFVIIEPFVLSFESLVLASCFMITYLIWSSICSADHLKLYLIFLPDLCCLLLICLFH